VKRDRWSEKYFWGGSVAALLLLTLACGGGGTPDPNTKATPAPESVTQYTGRLRDDNDAIVQGVFVFEGQRYPTNTQGEFVVKLQDATNGGRARIEAGTNYFSRVDNAKLPADAIGQRCMPQGNTSNTSITFPLSAPVAKGETVALGTFRVFTNENAVPPPCLNPQ
jgi:hypothetical protein